MRSRHAVLLIAAFALAGCDRITGAADQKILDAQAIGYACRVSLKVPEDCMKENETQSPTYVLNGWKEADKDIIERVIDPSMGKRMTATAAVSALSTPAAAHTPPASAKGVSGKTETELPARKLPDTKSTAPDKKQAKPVQSEQVKKPTP